MTRKTRIGIITLCLAIALLTAVVSAAGLLLWANHWDLLGWRF